MPNRIHIFGASGSGTTTLGRLVAEVLNGRFLDTDRYYWLDTDPPFTTKRAPSERVALIERDIEGERNWVLSGSICSWGDPLLHRFTLGVFLHLDPTIRLARIAEREKQRYGARIEPGGDMRTAHLEFMEWCRSYDRAKAPVRSLHLHEKWMPRLACPVIRLDSAADVKTLCAAVLRETSG